ncbi:MAG: SCO7613 C-terminal domain-containing membrane protein [Actinomycetes bacterium]
MSDTSTSTVTCPSCAAPLTGAPRCASCDLRLVGPDAQRLWLVDQRLAALGEERAVLVRERSALLARLALDEPPVELVTATGGPAAGRPHAVRSLAGPADAGPAGVQNTLLAMGGLLLALAATVFAAVTYSRAGVTGRVLIVLACTVAAVAATAVAARREMRASAEAAGFVAVALGVLDTWLVKHAGVAGEDTPWGWWLAGGFSVLAGLSLLLAWAVPVRTPLVAGVAFAQLPVPIVLGQLQVDVGTAAVSLALLAAADLVLVTVLGRFADPFARAVRTTTAAVALVPAAVALLLAAVAGVDPDEHLLGAAAFAVLAVPLLATALAGPVDDQTALRRTAGLLLAVAALDALAIGSDVVQHHAVLLAAAALVALGLSVVGVWTVETRLVAAVLSVPATLCAAAGSGQQDPWSAVLAFGALATAAGLRAATTRGARTAQLLAGAAVLHAAAMAAAVPSADGDSRIVLLTVVAAVGAVAAVVLPARLRWGVAAGASITGLAAWWLLLEREGVDTVEAYTLPLAGVLLAAGWLVRRHEPQVRSPQAYTAGLVLLLGPTLLLTFGEDGDDYLVRAVLLVAASTVVLLVGAALRLQALVVAGAVTLALTGLRMLLPYADDVPRWLSLGLAGALLFGVGATYEARRRDVARLRTAMAALD